MKGLENQEYLAGFIAFNILALIFLLCAIKWPRISRALFFLLFAWASKKLAKKNEPATCVLSAQLV